MDLEPKPDRCAVPFPLLADPDNYVACKLDLGGDHDSRAYWIGLFRRHLKLLIAEASRQYRDDPKIDDRTVIIDREFGAYLDAVTETPDRFGRLDIITICRAREAAMRKAGIDDAYHDAKENENEAALRLLANLLDDLDTASETERPLRLIEGVFAGNIFDLGATSTIELFTDGAVDFHATLAKLRPRPWLIDDLDSFIDRWQGPPYRSAVMFVDNAGCDVVLGMIPLARQLLRRGTQVLLTANTSPSLNDVTHDELAVLIDRIARQDATIRDALADGRLELAPSGNDVPLIDLAKVSPRLAEAVVRRRIDLIILEGMGRAIESNLDATFNCDTVKLAMIKDPGVAGMLGGELYDLVFRFDKCR